jgi:D-beta-D-heptose 7-phosphate kinase/D-beta-D-heptose 1-phosphate adenosyltransferase
MTQRSLPKGGFVTLEQSLVVREQWRLEGRSVGFTNGCFDLVHPGHIAVLRGAAAACDRLIVGINSDASVSKLKLRAPIQGAHARAVVISAIEGVDLVVIFDEEMPLNLILDLEPDVLVKGADYEPGEIVGTGIVDRLVRVPMVEGQSTTELIRRAQAA